MVAKNTNCKNETCEIISNTGEIIYTHFGLKEKKRNKLMHKGKKTEILFHSKHSP